jgi:SAM-dependent methyltransferase
VQPFSRSLRWSMSRSTPDDDVSPDPDSSQVLGRELAAWFATPPGQYLLAWEQARFDEAVVDRFGFNALQFGLPDLDALRANRMPHRWLAVPEALVTSNEAARVALISHAAALPFPEKSLDLVVLPHTLELSADPHAVLREVERVLVPEGRLVVCGLNPVSLWGLRQYRSHAMAHLGLGGTRLARRFLPEAGEFIGPWRLKDWLKLLSFDVQSCHFGCYRPAVRSDKWLQRWRWMDQVGSRSWPILGAVYFLEAAKRVKGMHLLGPAWKPRRSSVAPVAVVQRPSLKDSGLQRRDVR